MLKLMRENLKSLSWILAFVVASFVFALFSDWGGKGRWLGGPSGDWAVEVEGTSIPVRDFLSAARNLDSYYRSLLGESYDPDNMQGTITQQALSELVREEVILFHARALGLKATAEEIRDEIVRDPNLQGESGFIGADRYKSLLRSSGIDPAQYEEDVARQVLQRKWAEMMTADIAVTDEQVAREIRRREETADVLYAHFRPDDHQEGISLTDEEIEAYFQENVEGYRRGEGRVFDLVVFDRLREQEGIEVTEDEARTHYEASVQSRFTVPEQRRASHILIKTQQGASEAAYQAARSQAEEALQRVLTGEDFAEVAKEVSEDTSAANGGDLGFFQRGVMAVPFEDAVWELAEIGAISNVVQTQFGYHVIQLTGVEEARVKDFEEVSEEIRREIAFRRSGEVVRQEAESFAAAVRDNPASLRDAAALQSLVTTSTGTIHEGDPIPGIGFNSDVQRALFSLLEGELSAPIAIPRGYLVARFVESQPGGPPPLDEIRDQVEADLRQERATAEAGRRADLASAAADADDLRAKGEELEFSVEEASSVTRGLAIGTLGVSPVLEAAVFDADPGKVIGPLELPEGPVVFVVTDRKRVTDEEIATQAPQARNQLLAGRRQQYLAVLTRGLMESANVVYNSELLAQLGATPGRTATRSPGS
jgi:peptidyl-prolyl cis-trans isomerase D